MSILEDSKALQKREEWYFVIKIVLTYCEKKCFSDQEKNLKFEAEGREFEKHFVMTTAIYSSSESSEQFLVTKCF